jgi:hypothetical protein
MPATRTRRRLLLAAALLIVLSGGLAVAAWARLPASGAVAAKPAVPAGPSVVAGSSSQNQPVTPHVNLAGLQWSNFYGVELPYSAAGPRYTSGGIAAGFARSPLGALLAAVNIGVRANAQWGPRIFTAVIRDQVTGPDAAALLANCQAAYGQASQSDGMTGGQPLGDVDVTEEAFRWVTYTPADAIIDLVSAAPGNQGTTVRASTQVQIVWDGGDWKVIAPPGGNWGNSATELSSLRGYTVFPGPEGGR